MPFILSRRIATKIEAPLQLDFGTPMVRNAHIVYGFTEGLGTSVRNVAKRSGQGVLTLGAGMTWVRDKGGLGINCDGTTNALGTTTIDNTNIDWFGSESRTFFCRFKPAADSSSSNQGGLFNIGPRSSHGMFSVRQNNETGFTETDQWCVDTNAARINFRIPNHTGNVHTIVVTTRQSHDPGLDWCDLKVYADGVEVAGSTTSFYTLNGYNLRIGTSEPSAGVASNHFNGVIYEMGFIGGRPWSAGDARRYHLDPFILYDMPNRMIASTIPVATSQSVVLTGIITGATMGSHVVGIGGNNVVLPGITPTVNLGSQALTLPGKQVFLPGITSTAMGGPTIANARADWESKVAKTNTWSDS